jgi:hypothetical protein
MVVGGAITAKYVTAKTEIKTQTVDHTVTVDHVITVTKEIVRPDGTKETTITKDDSSTKHDLSVSNKEDMKALPAPNWMVSGGVGFELDNSFGRVYKAEVARRILGPAFVGVYGTTRSEAGVTVGFEF